VKKDMISVTHNWLVIAGMFHVEKKKHYIITCKKKAKTLSEAIGLGFTSVFNEKMYGMHITSIQAIAIGISLSDDNWDNIL